MNSPASANRRTGICLNMIVKNEVKVLDRLFRSVQDYIDYYVIVDTGSSDGTQDFIRNWMNAAGIAGEIHERAWVNFGHNRQQALELAVAAARGDWLLFIDADEELVVADTRFHEKMEVGVSYDVEKHHDAIRYAVPHLLDIRETAGAGPGRCTTTCSTSKGKTAGPCARTFGSFITQAKAPSHTASRRGKNICAMQKSLSRSYAGIPATRAASSTWRSPTNMLVKIKRQHRLTASAPGWRVITRKNSSHNWKSDAGHTAGQGSARGSARAAQSL